MKLVGIGDLFMPCKFLEEGFKSLEEFGVEIQIINWNIGNLDEMQNISLLVENAGSEAYETPDYIIEAARDADIIVTQFCTITKKLIDECKNLKIIGIIRAGYDNVNVDYATKNNILVMNTYGRNSDAVADFTVGMLLSEIKNIAKSHAFLKNGLWITKYPNSGNVPDLPGKTVGIIGIGEIGLKVAKRLYGFDVNFLGFDPYAKCVPDYIKLVSLEELMAKSDFITVHARLTKENENMISRELINKMKPTSYFINTARAGLVDEDALYEALKNNKIAGAALDVFAVEPPGKDYPIVTLDNVTITPHMAGTSKDAMIKSSKILASEIAKIWSKQEPKHMLNKELYGKVIGNLIK